ncbi:LysR family transcriptional regulator [Baekduia soli]|uniref:LysR family transcriptional regulator n=1 Tax=Baekduia soli TaxID=496014 RepID=A0A5B8U8K4_9ACTN|nr:LysR family transcriptional regulator [Baekduia soli]
MDPAITTNYDRRVLLRQLEYLAALDRERHFGRASQACHVSQPALSAALRRLEDELGVMLVRRGRRFEGFTHEGERVLVWARRALAGAEGLTEEVQRLRGGLEGTLRLGAIPTSLPASVHVTSRLRRRHPRMRIEIRSMSSREIAAGLRAGELDAGLTYLDDDPLTDVDTLELWHERLLLVCAGESTAGATTTWAAAAELPLCLLTPDMQHRRIVDAAFAAATGKARGRWSRRTRCRPSWPMPAPGCPASPQTPGFSPTRCRLRFDPSRWSPRSSSPRSGS